MVQNPQANSAVERVHQMMGNVLRTFDIPDAETPQEQVLGTLAAIACGVCSAMHTTIRATPMQLAFGHDTILNTNHITDWKCTQSRKQNMMRKIHKTYLLKRKYCVLSKIFEKQAYAIFYFCVVSPVRSVGAIKSRQKSA